MLLHVTIQNVVIIDHVSMDFREGLNLFTGETGAGKSILIDALLLALGERASADIVRTGTDEAEVSALFDTPSSAPFTARLETAGIPCTEEILLRRSVSSSGRSRAWINDRPVTVALLREVGHALVEFSGQHAQQLLMQPRYHLHLLDSFGHLYSEREAVTAIYQDARSLRKEMEKLGGSAAERKRREEYLVYQMEELDQTPLDVDETKLEDERRYLLQVGRMVETSQEGEHKLYSGQGSVMEILGRLEHKLTPFAALAPPLQNALVTLGQASALIDDVARTLRDFQSNASHNPQRIEEIEENLSVLRELKQKHRVPSVAALRQRRQEYERELQTLHHQEKRLVEVEKLFQARIEDLRRASAGLSEKRHQAAGRLTEAAEAELASLGMKKARFVVAFQRLDRPRPEKAERTEISIEPLPSDEDALLEGEAEDELGAEMRGLSSSGFDAVLFLLSSNPGEEPRPLHKTASGGELSRIMLALKQILTEHEPVPTCIFDEVDSGIGGLTATIIGEKIKRIAHQRQVLCITHLPQIASFADRHFSIEKTEDKGRTRSTIRLLSEEERVLEITRMLGGKATSSQSLDHARTLLQEAIAFGHPNVGVSTKAADGVSSSVPLSKGSDGVPPKAAGKKADLRASKGNGKSKGVQEAKVSQSPDVSQEAKVPQSPDVPQGMQEAKESPRKKAGSALSSKKVKENRPS